MSNYENTHIELFRFVPKSKLPADFFLLIKNTTLSASFPHDQHSENMNPFLKNFPSKFTKIATLSTMPNYHPFLIFFSIVKWTLEEETKKFYKEGLNINLV